MEQIVEKGSSSGGNGSTEKNCPPHECISGGCGASSCTLTMNIWGYDRTVSTDVGAGYFACCYKDTWGNIYAKPYKSDDCCN